MKMHRVADMLFIATLALDYPGYIRPETQSGLKPQESCLTQATPTGGSSNVHMPTITGWSPIWRVAEGSVRWVQDLLLTRSRLDTSAIDRSMNPVAFPADRVSSRGN